MSNIAAAKGKLIAVIGDEDTCVGFLLGGIGEINKSRQSNFLVMTKNTQISELEDAFRSFTSRDDIAILLISQNIAELIRHLLDKYDKKIPAVLEIPSKDHPYDPNKDSILKGLGDFLVETLNETYDKTRSFHLHMMYFYLCYVSHYKKTIIFAGKNYCN